MNIQIAVLLLLALATAVAAGGLAGMTAVGVGAGPVAVAGIAIVLTILAGAAIGFVAFIVPISLLSAATLVFATTAGYRYLRWSRFLGVLANIAGAAYFLLLHHYAELTSGGVLAFLLALPTVNCLLFFCMPRRPNSRWTRRAVYVLLPCPYLGLVWLFARVFADHPPDFDLGSFLLFGGIWILLSYAFYYNFRTIPMTATATPALGRRLAISVGVSALAVAVFFPVGVPLALSTLLLLQLAEISFLYPDDTPPLNGVRYWAAKILGRLPATDAAAVSQPQPPSPQPRDDHAARSKEPNAPKRVYLIRHGEPETAYLRRYLGRLDPGLSPHGEEQARRVAERLAGLRPERIVASPLHRAKSTAEIIADACGLRCETENLLLEIDFGKLEGLTFKEASAVYPAATDSWQALSGDFSFPEGENFAAFNRRAVAMAEQIRTMPGRSIALVAHGGILRGILCSLLALEADGPLRFRLAYAAVTTVELYESGGATLLGFNVGREKETPIIPPGV